MSRELRIKPRGQWSGLGPSSSHPGVEHHSAYCLESVHVRQERLVCSKTGPGDLLGATETLFLCLLLGTPAFSIPL